MASKLNYKRIMTDKLSIKGELSADGTYITYEDDNKELHDIKIADLLKSFVNRPIDFTVSLKDEEDLSDMVETE